MRYQVRDRLFGIGDDYWITNEHGEQEFLVDGKALRLRETFELQDRSGAVVAQIHKKMFSLRDKMVIERGGEKLATVRKKHFTPLHDVYKVEMADGNELRVSGDIVDKEYDIEADGNLVATISRKWFSLRDAYSVEVPEGVDPSLLLCVAVCVDRLAERELSEDD
jgi:uncharacterized protein YxjI